MRRTTHGTDVFFFFTRTCVRDVWSVTAENTWESRAYELNSWFFRWTSLVFLTHFPIFGTGKRTDKMRALKFFLFLFTRNSSGSDFQLLKILGRFFLHRFFPSLIFSLFCFVFLCFFLGERQNCWRSSAPCVSFDRSKLVFTLEYYDHLGSLSLAPLSLYSPFNSFEPDGTAEYARTKASGYTKT